VASFQIWFSYLVALLTHIRHMKVAENKKLDGSLNCLYGQKGMLVPLQIVIAVEGSSCAQECFWNCWCLSGSSLV